MCLWEIVKQWSELLFGIILVIIEAEDILIIAGWHVREKERRVAALWRLGWKFNAYWMWAQWEEPDNINTISDCVQFWDRM